MGARTACGAAQRGEAWALCGAARPAASLEGGHGRERGGQPWVGGRVDGVRDSHGGLEKAGRLELVQWQEPLEASEPGGDVIQAIWGGLTWQAGVRCLGGEVG